MIARKFIHIFDMHRNPQRRASESSIENGKVKGAVQLAGVKKSGGILFRRVCDTPVWACKDQWNEA
jgi:hypothetical protein